MSACERQVDESFARLRSARMAIEQSRILLRQAQERHRAGGRAQEGAYRPSSSAAAPGV